MRAWRNTFIVTVVTMIAMRVLIIYIMGMSVFVACMRRRRFIGCDKVVRDANSKTQNRGSKDPLQ